MWHISDNEGGSGGYGYTTFTGISQDAAGNYRLTYSMHTENSVGLHNAVIEHDESVSAYDPNKFESGLEGNIWDILVGSMSLDKFLSIALANANEADWSDYTLATLGILGGAAEFAVGVLTSEVGIGVGLGIDGGYKTLAYSGKLWTLIRSGKKEGNGIPTSVGAVVGKIIDNNNNPDTVNSWQTRLGIANDVVSFFLSPNGLSPAIQLMHNALDGPVSPNSIFNTYIPDGKEIINHIP